MLSRRLTLRIGWTASIALAALSFGAVSANAGVLVSSAPSCDGQALSTPFQPWLDYASYTPVPGGNFESSAAGWTMSGGAAVADGNESFNVAGPGTKSLAIPSGGSATSPTMCVGLEHPTIRFFTKRTGGLLGVSTMRVDVLFESALGLVSSLPVVGAVLPSNSWQTQLLPMVVVANLLPLLPGQYTPVRFRFTPLLGGSWSVDDVYVDPYNRH